MITEHVATTMKIGHTDPDKYDIYHEYTFVPDGTKANLVGKFKWVGRFVLFRDGRQADGEWELSGVKIHEDVRNMGNCQLMMKDVLKEARKLGAKSMRLNTQMGSAAEHVYKKFGFVYHGESEHVHFGFHTYKLEVTK
jgi:predicted GNAT family N-acyltransferase